MREGRERHEDSRDKGFEAAARSGWRWAERVRRKGRRCRPTIPGGRAVGGLYPGCEVPGPSPDRVTSVSKKRGSDAEG